MQENKNSILKEEQEICSFAPKTKHTSQRSVSISTNKDKIEDFHERNNQWDAKRRAKWERLRDEKNLKEIEEVKSPNQDFKINNQSNNISYSKTKSISKRSNRAPISDNKRFYQEDETEGNKFLYIFIANQSCYMKIAKQEVRHYAHTNSKRSKNIEEEREVNRTNRIWEVMHTN